MSIDLKTASVEPVRRTFDHLSDKLGPNKNPSRYQEATWGLQPELNFHYRPTWDAERELYDPSRTAIVMADFDDLVDPRQYYYGTWTIQRGKQQDSQEKNFSLVEKHDLLASLSEPWRRRLIDTLIPIRHLAWGANSNNSYIAAYGFGAPVTSACAMQMMDHLAVAQYISRVGLLLADNQPEILDQAKQAWLSAAHWQGLRKLIEDSMVTKDWFELFVLQNFLLDGVLYPLLTDHFGPRLVEQGGAAFPMLTEFINDWRVESSRWVDAVLKRAAAESDSNQQHLSGWIDAWQPQVRDALRPWAEEALDEHAAEALNNTFDAISARALKAGIAGRN